MATAGDFFIVDNSDDNWKALEYLKQWCGISSAIDIATGHFEIGSLIALDGEWQKVPKIRLLIGGDTSRSTAEAVRLASAQLDQSLAEELSNDAFLRGVPAIVAAMRRGQITIKVYRKKKFHAKAYITHGTLDVVGSAALVGSSNFTRPGLTRNVELNVRFTGVEVRDLQDWYESHWQEAEEITAELLKVIERYERFYTPFEVYCRALQSLTASVSPGEEQWELNESVVYSKLAPYQRDAYLGLKHRARSWGGGLLTDGVGLGKTFVGLMLAEYYAVRERKNVLIMATKTGKDAVWEPLIRKLLPTLRGDFTNLKVLAHTDLSRQNAMEQVNFLAERADVIIIDEAHNFRNLGIVGPDPENPKARWYRMAKIAKGKTTFLLTATPINNSLWDLVHELQLFSGLVNDSYFADLGIGSLRQHIGRLEAAFASGEADFEKLLAEDKLLKTMIVQNSRRYAVESAKAENAEVKFPEQLPPRAMPYDYDMNYSALLSELEAAFKKDKPLFILPMYYPLYYSLKPEVDALVENRQKQVVGLIRTVFLKRFESSIAAFTGSCLDMTTRITNWIEANAGAVDGARARLATWSQQHDAVLADLHAAFRPERVLLDDDLEIGEDIALEEEGEIPDLNPAEYRMADMLEDAFADLDQMAALLIRCRAVGATGDTKYEQLKQLLIPVKGKGKPADDKALFDPAFAQQKVLVFTEFADTARYLHQRLEADGLAAVDRIDGSRKKDRVLMIKRFAPHYNEMSYEDRHKLEPLRVLISTDVLSEGVNLQDATRIVNYDIHWNPVRLMQRIGRVDRRLNPEIEKAIVAEDPKTSSVRGKIAVRNFLPNDELNRILSLYSRVQTRVLLISKTLGIPGGKLLDENDLLDDTKVFEAFLHEYQGDMSPVEQLRLKLLNFFHDDPTLESRVTAMPVGTHVAIRSTQPGLFLSTIEPARLQDDAGETVWSRDPGQPQWLFVGESGERITDLLAIDSVIACYPNTGAEVHSDPENIDAKLKQTMEWRHNELLKDQLPLDAPKPLLDSWIEVTL